MKRIHVNAIVPRASGSKWNQSATTEASNIALGVKKCLKDLLKQNGVKGLRHTHLSLEVTITHVQKNQTHTTSSDTEHHPGA